MTVSRCLLLISLLSLGTDIARAEQQFSWGGFLSAAYLDVSDNSFYGYDSGDSGPLLEAGLHGYWYLNRYFSVSGLVIARESGDWFESGLEIDYLNLTTQLAETESWSANVQLGRFKLSNGIYGATRDIPFTRPSIIMPQSIYHNIFREQNLRADGVRFNLSYWTESNQEITFSASVGKEPLDESFSRRFFGPEQSGEFEADWNTSIGLRYQPSSAWLFGFDYRRLKLSLKDEIVIPLPISETQFAPVPVDFYFDTDQYLLSVQYSQRYFEITSELTFREGGTYGKSSSPFGDFVTPAFDGSTDMQAFYLQGVAYVHPQWQVLLRYDRVHFTESDIPRNLKDLHDVVIGASWQPTNDLLVRLEHHWLTGTSTLPPVNDLPPVSSTYNPERHWRMLALELSYRF